MYQIRRRYQRHPGAEAIDDIWIITTSLTSIKHRFKGETLMHTEREELNKILDELCDDYLHMVLVAARALHQS